MIDALFSSIFGFFGDVVISSRIRPMLEGELLRERFTLVSGGCSEALFCFCFKNMASIPSLRWETGSIKVEDSVPTLPISFGTW